MDPFYEALSLFRRRKFEKCCQICTEILEKNPYDEAVWTLKMRGLTAQVMVDDIEADEEGIADDFLDTETIAQSARPGTSLRTAQANAAPGLRPRESTGRAVSGMIRPATQTGRATSLEGALRTPRTAKSARPITSHAARTLRLGTASMMTQPDGPFIQVSRLNMTKYASKEGIAKPLFEYVYYHENDIRNALDLAVEATKAAQFKDWWWKVALGKCYSMLGLTRDAEQQYRSALRQAPQIEIYLRLSNLYTRLDQPLTALDTCNQALLVYQKEVTLITQIARVLEALNNMPASVKYYREVLQEDATNVEAIACIAVNYFYSDQPEVALRYYRRLLQMGLYNAELFNNLGLCCYFAQHYDMIVNCFDRALSLAIGDTAADVWYNISQVAIVRALSRCYCTYSEGPISRIIYNLLFMKDGVGDTRLAEQCLRLCLSVDPNHGHAYNNLAVILFNKGDSKQALSYLLAAQASSPFLFESFYNHSLVTYQVGDYETSFSTVQKATKLYPAHTDSQKILQKLHKHFTEF